MSPYFDRTYFDGTYFDVDTVSSGRGSIKAPIRIVMPPDPLLAEDEDMLWIT